MGGVCSGDGFSASAAFLPLLTSVPRIMWYNPPEFCSLLWPDHLVVVGEQYPWTVAHVARHRIRGVPRGEAHARVGVAEDVLVPGDAGGCGQGAAGRRSVEWDETIGPDSWRSSDSHAGAGSRSRTTLRLRTFEAAASMTMHGSPESRTLAQVMRDASRGRSPENSPSTTHGRMRAGRACRPSVPTLFQPPPRIGDARSERLR